MWCCVQEIANTLWAFATLEHNPGSGMLDAAAAQIARRIEQFSPQVPFPPPGLLHTPDIRWIVLPWLASLPVLHASYPSFGHCLSLHIKLLTSMAGTQFLCCMLSTVALDMLLSNIVRGLFWGLEGRLTDVQMLVVCM